MAKLFYDGSELSVTNPELIKEWDFDKNYPLTPDDVTHGSSKKVWWICAVCGNEWQAVIGSRAKGAGCPSCGSIKAGKQRSFTLAERNSFSEKYAEIAKQWHPTKNGDLLPSMVSCGSNKNVWWICSVCGYEWQASPNTRTRGCGCPVCAGRKVMIGYNDLATTEPELARQWDYEKNGDLTPQMFTRGSHKRVWWVCNSCKKSWESTIDNRLKGNNCPSCGAIKQHKAHQLSAAKRNNLVENNPEIASEWNYEKNEEPPENYSCRSNRKVWWKCKECGHEWQATINDRTGGNNGCPKCSMVGSSFPEQAVFYYLSKGVNDAKNRYVIKKYEFDIYIPSVNTAVEYDGAYYHGRKRSIDNDNKKDAFCAKNGIRLIRIRDRKLPQTDSAEIIECRSRYS